MKTLSGLDASFLYLETPEQPMHVGSFHLYELPAGFKGSFHKAVREHLARRIHLAPIFSRKLAFMPLDLGHPLWVEADEVDLDFHVRKASAATLTVRQAEALCARLHGQLVDRSRPLWEFHVFDRIKRPDGSICAGFYSKIHHAALDGKGGTVLANAVLDLGPVPREVPPPDTTRRGRRQGDLKIGQMIGAVFSNSMAQYAKIAKSLPAVASNLGSTLARKALPAAGGKGLAGLKPKLPVTLAPRTMFNVPITGQRVFATASVPFDECRAMAKTIGASFNDIVLWLCSTALRSYLSKHGTLPRKPLVAAMPISLRDQDNQEMNNQASIAAVDLGTHLAHPMKRMNAIMASTAKVKNALVDLKSILPTDYPSLLAPWIVGGVAKAAFKTYASSSTVAERVPLIANLAISNVPGPQVPLYMAGAKMLTFHPLSIVTHGLGLNITIQTYAGSVDFGIIGDRNAVPQVHDLADALLEAFKQAQKLHAMAQPAQPAPAQLPAAALATTTGTIAPIKTRKDPHAPSQRRSRSRTPRSPAAGPGSARA